MNSSLIQLLVLAGIAIFLILKLRSVLGTRDGFEKPALPAEDSRPGPRQKFEVIDGGPDRDITDHTSNPVTATALAAMKSAEPAFNVTDFLKGARQAYEMILMAYDRGDLAQIKPFLGEDVAATFAAAIAERDNQGLKVDSTFAGIREMQLTEATYDQTSKTAEISVRFTGELSRTVRDKSGTVIDGGPTAIIRQRDTWTFTRRMGVNDPNWQLTATGD
jgi:predicted lipid-binding transport protein (Tim44 family)